MTNKTAYREESGGDNELVHGRSVQQTSARENGIVRAVEQNSEKLTPSFPQRKALNITSEANNSAWIRERRTAFMARQISYNEHHGDRDPSFEAHSRQTNMGLPLSQRQNSGHRNFQPAQPRHPRAILSDRSNNIRYTATIPHALCSFRNSDCSSSRVGKAPLKFFVCPQLCPKLGHTPRGVC